jgi:hypothetical protein
LVGWLVGWAVVVVVVDTKLDVRQPNKSLQTKFTFTCLDFIPPLNNQTPPNPPCVRLSQVFSSPNMHDVDTQPANQDDFTFPDDVDYLHYGYQ